MVWKYGWWLCGKNEELVIFGFFRWDWRWDRVVSNIKNSKVKLKKVSNVICLLFVSLCLFDFVCDIIFRENMGKIM